ncbi:MAG: cupin [Symploca sp. SIO3C6]|uniref:Cupin n=1 Tax=Symploca sp. SIO1C4 TaxID=2607765 RepID=A0A6B3NEH1_9CYAN|nr:cupin [Symploca sp. SIO3C6]NER29997.1 cupin [Symploca sp. SIO1C4]NET05773.1 cupin [Symploca sp. SIO2B6]
MGSKDIFVTGNGQLQVCQSLREWDFLRENYRLYRFLTEVEDILSTTENEYAFLPKIRTLVRQLITNSYWWQIQDLEPCNKTGTSVKLLYDELGFPLTVQIVKFLPGVTSTIHNHGTWGVVAMLKGQEKNTFWKPTITADFKDKTECKDKIELVGEQIIFPGDIISFTSDAIHCVEAMGDEPTITFNLYGETNSSMRFEFDSITHCARRF